MFTTLYSGDLQVGRPPGGWGRKGKERKGKERKAYLHSGDS